MGRILRGMLLVVLVAPGCDGQEETARHDLRPGTRATNGEPSTAETASLPDGLSTLEIIEEALRRNKIAPAALPDYLAFAHLESNFDPYVVSPVGAVGLFQLMPATALSLAGSHPDVPPDRLVIYNPTWRSGRRLLFAGPARRYPMRVLRWYGAHLKRFVSREEDPGLERLVAADSRFDPLVNALLATHHVERLKKRYFGRYRCFRGKGRKICGNFSGRHATMMAAACFHLGTPSVSRAIAETGARSFQAYIRATLRSNKRSHRDNGRYLRRLWRLAGTYRRLAAGGRPQRDAVGRAFRDPAIAKNLYKTYPVAR